MNLTVRDNLTQVARASSKPEIWRVRAETMDPESCTFCGENRSTLLAATRNDVTRAAATSVQANLSVVSQLLKFATGLRHARGQEHTCRRQGNSVTGGKWLWHRHGQDILRKLHERGPACLPTNRTSHLSPLVTCGSPTADTVGGSFTRGRISEPRGRLAPVKAR